MNLYHELFLLPADAILPPAENNTPQQNNDIAADDPEVIDIEVEVPIMTEAPTEKPTEAETEEETFAATVAPEPVVQSDDGALPDSL